MAQPTDTPTPEPMETPTPLQDLTGDGNVNEGDLLQWLAGRVKSTTEADFDQSGKIDFSDLFFFGLNWN